MHWCWARNLPWTVDNLHTPAPGDTEHDVKGPVYDEQPTSHPNSGDTLEPTCTRREMLMFAIIVRVASFVTHRPPPAPARPNRWENALSMSSPLETPSTHLHPETGMQDFPSYMIVYRRGA